VGLSDTQLDDVQAALDAGKPITPDVLQELVEEVRTSRHLLGVAARAIGVVGGEVIELAGNATELVAHYRASANGAQAGITLSWPDGFEPPRPWAERT
jgi:hypothetical protein